MGKYEEALERARQGLPMGKAFPELHMSEDERIRKGIIHFILYEAGNQLDEETEHAFITWLEKQKPLSSKETELNSIAFLEEMGYTCIPPGIRQFVEWSEDDEMMREKLISYFYGFDASASFSGREVVEIRLWLKSLRPQPQGTYRQIVHNIYEMLKDKDFTEITPGHRVSLLNDIRVMCGHADEWAGILDEPSWKPSEEQMAELYNAAIINAVSCPSLKSLYNDLQKLL